MENHNISVQSKPETDWPGMTLEELRYQRALTIARIEIAKELIMIQGNQLYQGKVAGPTHRRGVFGRMLSTLSVVDYAMLAFKFSRRLASVYRSFKK